MQPLSLFRTGTTSKWFATNPRPNPSVERAGEARPPLMSNVELPLFGGLPGVSSARYGAGLGRILAM
jgi:hypothetical protein